MLQLYILLTRQAMANHIGGVDGAGFRTLIQTIARLDITPLKKEKKERDTVVDDRYKRYIDGIERGMAYEVEVRKDNMKLEDLTLIGQDELEASVRQIVSGGESQVSFPAYGQLVLTWAKKQEVVSFLFTHV